MRDVYSRRMFQNGGEVLQSKPIFRGGRVPTPAGAESIERVDTEDGTYFLAVVRGNDGEVKRSRVINLNLDLFTSPSLPRTTARKYEPSSVSTRSIPVSYTHLTLPTNREV